jgi:hypothetical protein
MKYYALINHDGTVGGMHWSENEITGNPFPPEMGIASLVPIPSEDDYPAGKVYKNGVFVDQSEQLSSGQKAVRVMFRTLAQTDVIAPTDALDNAGMFPVWADCIGQRAEAGSYWRHGDKLYRVNAGQGHTIQADWAPDKAVSLFSLAANPADEWPEWIQPTGAHNAYAKGSKVTHNGQRWVSTADGNVWAPGVYGWANG